MRNASLVLVAVATIAAAGCLDEPVEPESGAAFAARVPRYSVIVSIASDTLVVGDSAQAVAEVRDRRGKIVGARTVAWTSLDTTVASVSGGGIVRGVHEGRTVIRASISGSSDQVAVLVIGIAPIDTIIPTDTVIVPTDTLPPADTSGIVAAVTNLSRDAGSAAGGAIVRVNGANFVSGAVVAFGGVSAATTYISPTVLEAVAPAHDAGTVAVTVTQSGIASITSANFQYLPAPTTNFARSDFEDGTLGSFSSTIYGAGETVSVSTERVFSGLRAVKCAAPIAGHQAEINYTFADNRMLLEANGIYVRFFVYVPDATVASAQGGQIKLQLVRSKNMAPAWIMSGLGVEFSGQHPRAFVTMIDNGTVQIPGTFWSPFNFGDAAGWVEVQYWYTRKNGTGRARGWLNGKLAFDVTDGRLGGDLSTSPETVRLGIVYQQNLLGSSAVYLDKVAIANGFIDP